MSRRNVLVMLILCPIIWSGCSMCCAPYDDEYPILNNERYPRLNAFSGRVGSTLSDPNVKVGEKPTTNADIPRDEDIRKPIEDDLDDPNFNLDAENSLDFDTTLEPELPRPEPQNINTSAGLIRSWR
ncbi:MAG: hypothetical protein P8J91_13545 [Pirellulaceae bacterium]|nr:hypothetical protein [Pirellulaceae bacterium]MDG2104769.1 hypothetical protein [Pirellulaceae bacterium]